MATPDETATLSAMRPVLERATVEQSQQPRRLWRLEQQGLSSSEEADLIAVRVLARLTGRLLRLRILVGHDGLVLQGRARSYYAKQLVQEAVRKVTDTPIAENAVEIV